MICALHFVDGMDVAEIQKVSKTGKATIDNYVRDFESGKRKKGDVTSFRNLALNTAQLCELYGAVSTLV
jgi:transposase